MFNQQELLQAKTMGEIRTMVTQHGMGWDKTEKKAELISRLLEVTLQAPVERGDKADKKENKPEYEALDVMEALRPFMERGLEVKVDGDVWSIRFNGRIESGNVNIPRIVIQRCAQAIMRG